MERGKDQYIVQLCECIEAFVGRHIRTPKDFNFLRGVIFTRTHQYISTSTLKRIWGYLHETNSTRLSTLDLLSRFLNFQDWADFQENFRNFHPVVQEGEVTRKKLLYSEVELGQLIEVSWMPDSCCIIECMGNKMFRVISSTNTRLSRGDIVNCYYIVEGESFYFVDSIINGTFYELYYIGKTGGVNFRILK